MPCVLLDSHTVRLLDSHTECIVGKYVTVFHITAFEVSKGDDDGVFCLWSEYFFALQDTLCNLYCVACAFFRSLQLRGISTLQLVICVVSRLSFGQNLFRLLPDVHGLLFCEGVAGDLGKPVEIAFFALFSLCILLACESK